MSVGDQYLIKSVQEGNKEAFKYIYDKYYAPLCIHADRYVRDHNTAEDIVSKLIATLYEKRDKLLINTSLVSYLYNAVRNSALNYLRDNKKVTEGRISLDQLPGSYEFAIREKCTDSLIAKELEDKIVDAIEKLPPKCREVFIKSRFEEKSYKEIAEELNISVNSVENHVAKALKKLRVHLKDYITAICFIEMLN